MSFSQNWVDYITYKIQALSRQIKAVEDAPSTGGGTGAFADLTGAPEDNAALQAALDEKVSSETVTTIWTGSQAEYDAIVTPDANTLYFIEE
jgi:hypothetical protein